MIDQYVAYHEIEAQHDTYVEDTWKVFLGEHAKYAVKLVEREIAASEEVTKPDEVEPDEEVEDEDVEKAWL